MNGRMRHLSIIALSVILTVLPLSIIHQRRGQGGTDMLSVLSVKAGRQLSTLLHTYSTVHTDMHLDYEYIQTSFGIHTHY